MREGNGHREGVIMGVPFAMPVGLEKCNCLLCGAERTTMTMVITMVILAGENHANDPGI